MACREGYRRLGDTGTNLEDVLVVDLLIAASALLHLTHLPLDSGGGRHYHSSLSCTLRGGQDSLRLYTSRPLSEVRDNCQGCCYLLQKTKISKYDILGLY